MPVDWGTAPDWVAAIGTSGSLLLGFPLLARDRLQGERRDAELVLCFIDWPERRMHVVLENAGPRLVVEATVYYIEPRDDELPPLEQFHRRRQAVRPTERVVFDASGGDDGRNLKPRFRDVPRYGRALLASTVR